jgi:hypothetical protein
MSNAHQILASISDDDPEVRKALAGIKSATLPIAEVISSGPFGRTRVYEHIGMGLLITNTICGRRFAYALDYAKYLVALTRFEQFADKVHPWAAPEGRPARDPKSTRATAEAA